MVIWTATKIEKVNYCTMRFYLNYSLHKKPLLLAPYSKGILIHEVIQDFWLKLGDPEQVRKKSSPIKYSNSEEFKSYFLSKWMQRVISSEKSDNKINWSYEEQPWVIKSQISKLAKPLYNYLIKNGKPLFSEMPFKFSIDNKDFSGRIDEVRLIDSKVVIRDYKSGWPWMEKEIAEEKPQLTLYNIGLTAICKQDPRIARLLGLEKKVNQYLGNPIFIDDSFKHEFFMIEALPRNSHTEDYKKEKDIPDIIVPSKRTENHLLQILSMIDGTMEKISSGNIYPEKSMKCNSCDVKHACREEMKKYNSGFFEDKNGQIYLSFDTPKYLEKNIPIPNNSNILKPYDLSEKPLKKKREKSNQLKLKLRKKS